MRPSTFWRQITALPQSRSSRAASVPQPSTTMVTTWRDPHHHPSDLVFQVAPTAILPAQQVLSAITAPHAQVHVAVLVNATASLAEGTVSNSTAEVLAVATVTILVLAVLPALRKNTFLVILADMVL